MIGFNLTFAMLLLPLLILYSSCIHPVVIPKYLILIILDHPLHTRILLPYFNVPDPLPLSLVPIHQLPHPLLQTYFRLPVEQGFSLGDVGPIG